MPDISGATVLNDLPDSIIIWEILVRLPPKDVFRCRAVRKSWRKSTSTRDFLLAHHRHQLSFPVIKHFPNSVAADPHLAVFRVTDAGNQKLWPVLRYAAPRTGRDSTALHLHASRDGLLVISSTIGLSCRERVFYVCNPATRQYTPLPQLFEHDRQVFTTSIVGFYLYHPSGEYRVLYYCRAMSPSKNDPDMADYYITAVGSNGRRFIGRPPASSVPSVEQELLRGLPCSHEFAPVLHRGCLHWDLGRYNRYFTGLHDIMVFDTVVETFRWLRRPTQAPLGLWTSLLELDGALALFSAHDGVVMDVFVMQDYEDEVWALRYQIDLSAAMPKLPQFDLTMVVVKERELLIQIRGRLLHSDINGNVLGIVECHGDQDDSYRLQITTHSFRESIVRQDFFETQQGTGVSNDPPFFFGL